MKIKYESDRVKIKDLIPMSIGMSKYHDRMSGEEGSRFKLAGLFAYNIIVNSFIFAGSLIGSSVGLEALLK